MKIKNKEITIKHSDFSIAATAAFAEVADFAPFGHILAKYAAYIQHFLFDVKGEISEEALKNIMDHYEEGEESETFEKTL